VDRVLRGSSWRLKAYISFQVRTVLLVILLPLFILLGVYDLLSIAHSRGLSQVAGVPLHGIVIPLVVICIYLFAPLVLKGLWRARALPAGPLRARLEETAKKVNFKCAGLFIWPTSGGHILTACVAGLLSRLRYVLFTDDLLASLSPQEVEAVLAHEIAHIKKHHFRFYLLFAGTFIIFLILLDVFLSFLMNFLGFSDKITEATGLAVLSAAFLFYWGLLFGYISRRLERQADLYGANLAGSAALVNALEKLALLSGLPRKRYYSWRHFSISQRIDFLMRAEENPEVAHRFQRGLRRLILGIIISFVVGLLITFLLILFAG
jgi:Zn-dependent protease with chaperone function